jgi:frataxin-like iron-binding protein CyaY
MIVGKIENLNPMVLKQDMRPNKMIWVTFRKEGMHRYPAAATDPSLATGDEYDVSFLANEHRHIFHFRVWLGVTHNDRDVEFIQFKRWLEKLYSDAILKLDHKSCEMMSDDLYDVISKKYPNREIWIEVSEDGENGSFIKY